MGDSDPGTPTPMAVWIPFAISNYINIDALTKNLILLPIIIRLVKWNNRIPQGYNFIEWLSKQNILGSNN